MINLWAGSRVWFLLAGLKILRMSYTGKPGKTALRAAFLVATGIYILKILNLIIIASKNQTTTTRQK